MQTIQWESKNKFLDNYIKKSSNGWGTISYKIECDIDGAKEHIKNTEEVDLSNYDLYIKKSIHGIQTVFFSMIIVRPIKTIIKTGYHICLPLSIPKEIYSSILKEKTQLTSLGYLRLGTTAAIKSIIDVVRTPIYGVALTIIAIAGLAISFIQPACVNDIRKLHGKIELALYWGNKHRCLVQCFVPMENLMKIERRNRLIEGISECQIKAFYKPKAPFKQWDYDIFPYNKESNPLILGLANWAHSNYIKSQRLESDDMEAFKKLINMCL